MTRENIARDSSFRLYLKQRGTRRSPTVLAILCVIGARLSLGITSYRESAGSPGSIESNPKFSSREPFRAETKIKRGKLLYLTSVHKLWIQHNDPRYISDVILLLCACSSKK